MTGRLLHYRSEPLEFEPARTYVHRESWTYGKPDGFWVSVEGQDDWPAWCRSEEIPARQLAACLRGESGPGREDPPPDQPVDHRAR